MFCSKCGSKAPEGANFCAQCGAAILPVLTQVPQEEKPYKLTIQRADQFMVVNPAIRVVLDEKEFYAVPNGTFIQIPVSAGEHKLNLSCGEISRIVTVQITADLTLRVKWNRFTGDLVVEG